MNTQNANDFPNRKTVAIAEKTGCAIVLIGHMNKGGGAKAAYRGMGSIDFFAVARSVILVGRIEGQEQMRAVIQIKNNLAAFGHAKAFALNAEEMFDTDWFNSIRIVRNKLAHEGATCVIFDNEDEPLFQVYNLEVDELLDPNDFLSNGTIISCKYFISITISELIHFINTVVRILEIAPKAEKVTFENCSLNYDVMGKTSEQEYVDKIWDRCGYGKYIPVYQETYLKMIQKYCTLK